MQSQTDDRVIAYQALVWIIGIVLLAPAVVGVGLVGSALGSDRSVDTQGTEVEPSVVGENSSTSQTPVTKPPVFQTSSIVETAISAALVAPHAPAAPAPAGSPQSAPESAPAPDTGAEPPPPNPENTKPSEPEPPSTSPPTTTPAGPTTTEPEEPERRPFPRFPNLFPPR